MKYLAIGLAVVLFVLAALYGAGVLQIATSDPAPGKHHLGHLALCAGLGVLALVWSRFAGKAPAN